MKLEPNLTEGLKGNMPEALRLSISCNQANEIVLPINKYMNYSRSN